MVREAERRISRGRTLLLVITIITVPLSVLELLGMGDVLRAVLDQIVHGSNPAVVFSVEYTANNVGMSKDLCIACWPFFVSTILCVSILLKRDHRFGVPIFPLALVVSSFPPIVSTLFGYRIPAWSILLFAALSLGEWMALSKYSLT